MSVTNEGDGLCDPLSTAAPTRSVVQPARLPSSWAQRLADVVESRLEWRRTVAPDCLGFQSCREHADTNPDPIADLEDAFGVSRSVLRLCELWDALLAVSAGPVRVATRRAEGFTRAIVRSLDTR